MNKQPSHNLNIHMYSLDELLGLFELSYTISIEDLKRAKKRVLMLHPDKSKLPSEYFLFYKKAFDMVVQFYENQNKQNQVITEKTTKYEPVHQNENHSTKIGSVIKKMTDSNFQDKFNQLFEENMSKKPNQQKNEWFTKEDPVYDVGKNVSVKDMGREIDRIKQTNQGVIKYQGVQQLYSSNSGNNFYDDDDESDTYMTSDPFSKLKYDDLRKVHKDETVFSVSENDFNKVQQYSSVDHFVRERSKQTLNPIEKQQAEHMLQEKERIMKEQMMQRQYQSNLKTVQYAEKNKSVLSYFLQLEK